MKIKNLTRIVMAAMLASASFGVRAEKADIDITENTPSFTEKFNSMWNAESSVPRLGLPSGCIIERNLTIPRKVSSSADATQNVMCEGDELKLSKNSKRSLSDTLVKGNTYTASTKPDTYDVTFSLADGSCSLTKVKYEASTMVLNPMQTVLVPRNPEKIKVLSLNNSLIYYNDQDKVFNDIAASMGKDAVWTTHTLLGKSLSAHWDEGDSLAEDGTPGAKMMVRSEAWSHIILQEQSSLPRTSLDSFRANVKQWTDYIREYCPNPNVVIILPVNWAYSSDWDNFSTYNKQFIENYTAIAEEMGVTVCPIAAAYDNVFRTEGTEATMQWFLDDRHPSLISTYVAACMEYGLIYGEDPATINSAPEGLDTATAEKMRHYASEALNGYQNRINHHKAQVRFNAGLYDAFGIPAGDVPPVVFDIDGGGSITADGLFQSDGTIGSFIVTAKVGNFEKKATIKVTEAENDCSHLTFGQSYSSRTK